MKSELKKCELDNCTFVKTCLMFVIVLYHCFLFAKGEGFAPNSYVQVPYRFNYIIDWFSSFQNYTFVFISGYLFSYVKNERGGYKTFSDLLKKKSKRLLVPYLFVVCIWVNPWKMFYYNRTLQQVAFNTIWGVDQDQLWFILMLFEVSCLFWWISKVINSERIDYRGLVIFVGLFFVGVIGKDNYQNTYRVFDVMQMLLFYYLGYCWRKVYFPSLYKITTICLLMTLHIALFGIYELIKKYNMNPYTFGLPTRLLMVLTGVFAIFALLQYIAMNLNFNNRTFSFLSERSMPVYLLHQQIIYSIVYLVYGEMHIFLSIMVSFVGTMIISLLFSSLLLRYKWTRVMIGS